MPTARSVALALLVVAAALVVAGLAMGSTGTEFGALAAIGAARLVHDSARSTQVAEAGAVEVTS